MTFAGFFHIYRYSLSQASVVPPPPLVPLSDERPKALGEEPKPSETPQLPEGKPAVEEKEPPKKVPQESPTPQIKADSGLDLNKDPEIGTSEIKKP